MAIETIELDDTRLMSHAIFPQQDRRNMDYLKDRMQNFSRKFNEVGRAFMERGQKYFEHINDSSIIRKAKRIAKISKRLLYGEEIMELATIEDFQLAGNSMRRYIMANIVIREIYQQQRCDGYNNLYTDRHPGKIGESHYDYRRVMDGVAQFKTEEDGTETTSFKFYIDEPESENERELSVDDKMIILSAWRIAEAFIKNNVDPTNPTGGEIGG